MSEWRLALAGGTQELGPLPLLFFILQNFHPRPVLRTQSAREKTWGSGSELAEHFWFLLLVKASPLAKCHQNKGRPCHAQQESIAKLQKDKEAGIYPMPFCRTPGSILSFSQDNMKYGNRSVTVGRCRGKMGNILLLSLMHFWHQS